MHIKHQTVKQMSLNEICILFLKEVVESHDGFCTFSCLLPPQALFISYFHIYSVNLAMSLPDDDVPQVLSIRSHHLQDIGEDGFISRTVDSLEQLSKKCPIQVPPCIPDERIGPVQPARELCHTALIARGHFLLTTHLRLDATLLF